MPHACMALSDDATWGSHHSTIMSDTDVPATADELSQFGDDDDCDMFDEDDDYVIEARTGEPSGTDEREESGVDTPNVHPVLISATDENGVAEGNHSVPEPDEQRNNIDERPGTGEAADADVDEPQKFSIADNVEQLQGRKRADNRTFRTMPRPSLKQIKATLT